jgi:hypothetical protein
MWELYILIQLQEYKVKLQTWDTGCPRKRKRTDTPTEIFPMPLCEDDVECISVYYMHPVKWLLKTVTYSTHG